MSHDQELKAFESLRASYEQARAEGETGDVSLDMLLITSEPAFSSLLRSLAIPHWFDEQIVEWLTPAELSDAQTQMMENLASLSFVRSHRRGLVFHDNVRERLRLATAARHAPLFREVSSKLEEYFAQWGDGVQDETLRWERIYHLVAVDENRGLDAFGEEFRRMRLERRYAACHTLAELLAEQRVILSQAGAAWADYYRGVVLFDTQQWDPARQLFSKLEVENLPTTLAGRLALYRGMAAEAHDAWPEAVDIYTEALKRLVPDDGVGLAPRLHQRLAEAHFKLGNLPAAERNVMESLRLNTLHGDAFGQALNNRVIGRIRAELGDTRQAALHYEQALAALDKAGRNFAKATIYTDLAKLWLAQSDLSASERFYQKAVSVRSEAGDNYGLAVLYLDLGNLEVRRGEMQAAIRCFDRSYAIFERFADRRSLAKVLRNKAVALEQFGDVDGAIAVLREAIGLLPAADTATEAYQRALRRLELSKRMGRKFWGCLVVTAVLLALSIVVILLESIFADIN